MTLLNALSCLFIFIFANIFYILKKKHTNSIQFIMGRIATTVYENICHFLEHFYN